MNSAEDRRRAGMFLLTAFGLLVVLLGILAGVRYFTRETTYIVEFRESVAGLEMSSPVKYNGVPVGKVGSIRFHPTDLALIQVLIEVNSEIPIHVDTRAQLKPQGITGIFYLELYGGTKDAPLMEPGEVIPSDASLTAKIGGIATDLSELLASMNHFVKNNEENLTYAITDFRASAGSIRSSLEKVDRVVDGAGAAVEEARAGLQDLRAEVKAAGESVRRAIAEVEELLKDPALRGLAAKADGTLERVNAQLDAADTAGISAKIKQVLDRFQEVEDSVDRAAVAIASLADQGKEDVTAVLADMRAASANVKALTRSLREDPSSVLKGKATLEKPIPNPLPPVPEDHR